MAANRKRKIYKLRFRGVVVILIIALSAVFGAISAQAADNPDDLTALKAVYVVEGDTLWSLVDQHYDTDDDIREAIYQVKKINNIESSDLMPGEVIYIPLS